MVDLRERWPTAPMRRGSRPGRRRLCGRSGHVSEHPARLTRGRILAVETSCDETAVAVVEGGRRIVANVVASQVALHARDRRHRARGRGARPPALDDPGARGGARASRHRATGRTLDAVAVTEGPGLAGSLLVGHHDGQDAGLGARPAARAGQPPRGPHLRRVAARPRRGGDSRHPSSRSSRSSSAAATRSSSRCPTTCATGCSARRSTTRRARRSTRSAGCSACPTRAARRSWPRPLERRCMTGASRAPGWATRSTSRSAASRRPRGGRSRAALGPARRRARRRRRRACPTHDVAELAWAFQDSVVDVLATKTLRAARAIGARTHRPRRRSGREQRAARADRGRGRGAGHPARRAAARAVHRQRGDDRRRRRGTGCAGRGPRRTRPRRAALAQARGRERAAGAATSSLDAAHLGRSSVERYLRRHGLAPDKRLTQNHLVDGAGARGDRRGGRRPARTSAVLEVGPGLGILTGALLERGARSRRSRSTAGWPRISRTASRSEPALPARRGRRPRRRRRRDLVAAARGRSSPTCRTTSPARCSTTCSAASRGRSASC